MTQYDEPLPQEYAYGYAVPTGTTAIEKMGLSDTA
jgi:hypothetical protein